jgi:hypothetical protein
MITVELGFNTVHGANSGHYGLYASTSMIEGGRLKSGITGVCWCGWIDAGLKEGAFDCELGHNNVGEERKKGLIGGGRW